MSSQQITPDFLVGIDLALKGKHVAKVMLPGSEGLGKPIRFGHTYDEYERMYHQVMDRVPEGARALWGCEVTAAAWRPISAFLSNRAEQLTILKPVKVADLRRFMQRHLKTDEVDAQVIGNAMWLDLRQGRQPSAPPSPQDQARRGLARRIDHLKKNVGSAKQRLLAILQQTMAPSLATKPYDWCAQSMLAVLHHFADLRTVAALSPSAFIRSACCAGKGGPRTSQNALRALHEAARDALRVYGQHGLDWDTQAILLQEAIQTIWDTQKRIQLLQAQLDKGVQQVATPQQRQSGQTVPGIGAQTLELLIAFLGAPDKWRNIQSIKQFAGLVPIVDNTGQSEPNGRMSKLGEPLLRKAVYQVGNAARQFDAQFAAYYYNQMVHQAKGHTAACIATGIRVINALRAVLRDQRTFQHYHPETGKPITKEQSQVLARTTYRVPEEIRKARRKAKHKRTADTDPGQLMKDMPKALPKMAAEPVPALS